MSLESANNETNNNLSPQIIKHYKRLWRWKSRS